MKLSRVDIHGFKSFAQRTELNFDKGITGIVGPNGSGKSNIADAVRWVLGEQSAKILRGSKMEDVIFNGTQTKKALPYCEVSLQFDNDDRALNSPYSEVLVTRRVYRNGEGEYFLNRSNCRLRDILELFRDTGIGKEGYSIIGQGRIEEILSTKGEERRQVFEEAAGIVTYRVRKEEAERKLSKTRDNLLRVSDLIEEISGRLCPLEEQAKTAQEYLSLSERLRGLEINLYLSRHDRLFNRLSGLKEVIDSLRDKVQQNDLNLHDLSQQRISKEDLSETLENQDQEAKKTFNALKEYFHSIEQNRQSERSRLTAFQIDEQRKSEELKKNETTINNLKRSLVQNEDERSLQLEQQIQAEAVCIKDEEYLSELLKGAHLVEVNLDTHKGKIISALTRMSDAKSMQARQQTMLLQMQEKYKDIQLQNHEALKNEKDLIVQADTLKKSKFDAEKNLSDLIEDALLIENKLSLANTDMEKSNNQLQEKTSQVQTAQNRLTLLEDLARDYEGYHIAVKKALQYAVGNEKVRGVVAQLITVPKQYETALDMILGGALQHIVTDDEQTAKSLIEYLRSNKLGRTTFLPISAIKGRTLNREEKQLLNQEGCIGIASELITFDQKIKGIAESLLGRTVLVDDMKTGITLTRLAKQSFNVVTLAGDVFRAGGAMTGGTSQTRSSSLLGRKREIGELKEYISETLVLLVQAKETKEKAARFVIELNQSKDESQEIISQQKIVLARQQERCDHAEKELRFTKNQLDELRRALIQLEAAITDIKEDLTAVNLQTQTDATDQKSMDEETVKLQNSLSIVRNQVEQQREKVASSIQLRNTYAHQYDLTSRDRSRVEKEISLLVLNTQKISKDLEQTKKDIDKLLQTIADFDVVFLEAEEAVRMAQENWDHISQSRSQIQSQLKNCVNEIERLHEMILLDNDKLHRNELLFARHESELQSLSDYIFNMYELTYALAREERSEDKIDISKTETEIKAIKQRIREMGSIHVGAVEEYAQTRERLQSMHLQHDDALQAERDLINLIDQLLGKMELQFLEEFKKLNNFFAETFSRLFGGGKAELILSDNSKPLVCDIEVAAQPPGKKLQMLSLLSGGERALTAIAILFAMLKLKPTPFCILDEIEAALDEANISNFADYLSEYAQSTQFIIITHRKGTMECCDALYGVAMEEKGISSMVSVNLHQYTAS